MKSILILFIVLVIAAAVSLTGGFSSFLQPVNQASLGSVGTTISGTSTGSNSTTTLNDTSKSFTPGSLVGDTITINTGTGAGESATITSNTNNQVTIDKPWPTLPDTSSNYTITTPGSGVSASSSSGGIIVVPPPNQNGQKLQLNTFTMITMTPTMAPTPAAACGNGDSNRVNCSCAPPPSDAVMCPIATDTPSTIDIGLRGQTNQRVSQTCPDGGIPCSYYIANPALVSQWGGCRPNDCIYIKNNVRGFPTANPNYSNYASCAGAHTICWDKPVIYLYSPTILHNVSVKIKIPGIITTSIPTYQSKGWQNLTVNPNGQINYQNKDYKELFYETSVDKNPIPANAFIFPTKNLSFDLNNLLVKLGFIDNERQEFLDYWLPKLDSLNKPYISVGILTPSQKNMVDNVSVDPEPQTRIEILMYFKGLTQIKKVNAPKIFTPPSRKGFTLVEWGGRIDNN